MASAINCQHFDRCIQTLGRTRTSARQLLSRRLFDRKLLLSRSSFPLWHLLPQPSTASTSNRASKYRGELSPASGPQPIRRQFPFRFPAEQTPYLTTNYQLLTTAVVRSGASALPCAGAPPPQRPLSYNMPRRPGVDIRNRCPIESVAPNHVPSVSDPVPLRQNCDPLSSLLFTLSSPLCLPSHPSN